MIAELLDDEKHKGLYMRISKTINNQRLLEIAKSVAEKTKVERKGAYFMKIIKESGLLKKKR